MTETIEKDKVLYFAEGNADALPFMDNETITEHLTNGGYSVTDLSEGGSLKSLDQKFRAFKAFGQMEILNQIGKWLLCWHWHYDVIRISVWDSTEPLREGQSAMIDAGGVVYTGDYAYQEILEVWEELNKRMAV